MDKHIDQRQATGRRGEDLAAAYLIQQQYTIIERNWRCRKGELDIIAQKDQCLIIVEVRSRRSLQQFGHPIESVERRKQQQLRKLAGVYVLYNNQSNPQLRFDVITVILSKDGSLIKMDHIMNAF